MTKQAHIVDSDDAWDDGQLGRDESFVAVAEDDEAVINAALSLQPISIRLEASLIEDFKMIASLAGLSYQPLMRQALRRFADNEKKRILREAYESQLRKPKAASASKRLIEQDAAPRPEAKAA